MKTAQPQAQDQTGQAAREGGVLAPAELKCIRDAIAIRRFSLCAGGGGSLCEVTRNAAGERYLDQLTQLQAWLDIRLIEREATPLTAFDAPARLAIVDALRMLQDEYESIAVLRAWPQIALAGPEGISAGVEFLSDEARDIEDLTLRLTAPVAAGQEGVEPP